MNMAYSRVRILMSTMVFFWLLYYIEMCPFLALALGPLTSTRIHSILPAAFHGATPRHTLFFKNPRK